MYREQIKENLKVGIIDIIVLNFLNDKPSYPYDIKKMVEERSAGLVTLPDGSLYAPFQRLQKKGYITIEKVFTKGKRFRQLCSITESGKKHLEEAKNELDQLVKGVTFILR